MKLEKYLESRINRKIIKFFFENPASLDMPRGIATWINANIDETEKGLKELVEAKIVVSHGNGATAAFGYTTDAYLISRIKIGLRKYKADTSINRH